MTSKDIIDLLKKHPDYEVTVSVDVGTDDSNYDARAFGAIYDFVVDSSRGEIVLLAIGKLNADYQLIKSPRSSGE